jgi:hypothetical protein
MTDCTVVQERLADEGIALMDRDAAIRAHVADCADCAPFAASLKRIDAGLTRLPPIDAPASLIEDTVRTAAGGTASADGKRPRDPGDNRLVTALAATVILAAGFGLVESVQQELDGLEQFYERQYADASRALGSGPTFGLSDDAPAALSAPSAPVGQATRRERNETREQAAAETQELPAMMMYAPPPAEPMPEPVLRGSASQGIRADTRVATDAISPAPLEEIASMKSFQAPAAAPARKENKKRDRQLLQEPERMLNIVSNADADRSGGEGREDDSLGAKRPASATESAALEPAFDQERRLAMANQRLMTPGKSGRAADAKDKLEKRTKNSAVGGLANVTGPRQVAKRFLAEQERLTGLAFQSATGYWANTYVPGDPAIRLLEARLQRWDRSMLTASLGDARLESAARQNWQPFDVPGNAALAAYLHADKPTVDGRSRLRVQVGLQASEKRSGLRPDMNVGVVLDLRRPLDDAAGTKLRALVNALTKARQPGDRFSITVAGHPGGLIVGPEDFRHGPIQVAMQSLFTRARDSQAPAMDLLAAMDTATDNVRQGDDASAPLGASLVLLVSTAPIAEQRRALESMAHENAVAGIGLSVVAVGAGADLTAIDHLVLLGQGHRRVLAACSSRSTSCMPPAAPSRAPCDYASGSPPASSSSTCSARRIFPSGPRSGCARPSRASIGAWPATSVSAPIAATTRKASRSSSRASSRGTVMPSCWTWSCRDRVPWPTSASATRISSIAATASHARAWRSPTVTARRDRWNATCSRISSPTSWPTRLPRLASCSPVAIAAAPSAR